MSITIKENGKETTFETIEEYKAHIQITQKQGIEKDQETRNKVSKGIEFIPYKRRKTPIRNFNKQQLILKKNKEFEQMLTTEPKSPSQLMKEAGYIPSGELQREWREYTKEREYIKQIQPATKFIRYYKTKDKEKEGKKYNITERTRKERRNRLNWIHNEIKKQSKERKESYEELFREASNKYNEQQGIQPTTPIQKETQMPTILGSPYDNILKSILQRQQKTKQPITYIESSYILNIQSIKEWRDFLRRFMQRSHETSKALGIINRYSITYEKNWSLKYQ